MKVKSVDARGAVLDLGNDTEAYLRASEISPDRVEDATTQLKVGDKVSAVITSVDRKTRNIQVSVKQKEAAEARRAMDRMNNDRRYDQSRRPAEGEAREPLINSGGIRGFRCGFHSGLYP